MKFAAAKEHRAFYSIHGWVEFEGLLEPEEVDEINQEIDHILCKRLDLSEKYLYRAQPEEFFTQGHDLWRDSVPLRRFCCRRTYAKIAEDLFGTSLVRLGCDQLYPGGLKIAQPDPSILLEYTSFQQVIGAIVFCLRGGNTHGGGKAPSPITPFPTAPGHAIFFPADRLLNLSTELFNKEDRYLMIVYTPQKTLYIKREHDPHNHTLKHIGYTFGDHLDNERHPMILR